jgi:hypothetical protein
VCLLHRYSVGQMLQLGFTHPRFLRGCRFTAVWTACQGSGPCVWRPFQRPGIAESALDKQRRRKGAMGKPRHSTVELTQCIAIGRRYLQQQQQQPCATPAGHHARGRAGNNAFVFELSSLAEQLRTCVDQTVAGTWADQDDSGICHELSSLSSA